MTTHVHDRRDHDAAAPSRRSRARSHGGIGHTIVGVAILAVLLFPVYWMLNVSLQHSSGAVATPWLPTDISLHGYSKALHDQGGHLLTSLEIALGSVVFSLLIAAPAAYALAQLRVRGAGVVLLVILISQMVPGIVVANALYSAYSNLGLLNSVWGLILADSTLGIPFAMLILRAFMLTHARVGDRGGRRWTAPGRSGCSCRSCSRCRRNALITAALFSFLFAWGDFLFALTLTTTEDVRPVTLGLYTYVGAFVADWSSVMATAVMASLPAVVLLVVAQRYVAAGTTAGAVEVVIVTPWSRHQTQRHSVGLRTQRAVTPPFAAVSGSSTRRLVPPPRGLSRKSRPPSASTRSLSPTRPVPRVKSAPPTPSSRTARRRTASRVVGVDGDGDGRGARVLWPRWSAPRRRRSTR